MGKYSDNLDFSRRVFENYQSCKDGVPHEYTHVCTALLSCLSALIPNGDIIITLSGSYRLPHIELFEDPKKYFLNIRNALAHKTGKIFIDNINFSGKIQTIRLTSRNHKEVELTLSELESILHFINDQDLKS